MDKTTLKLLSKEYPTVMEAAAQVVKLNAILALPKGTEYFFSDLHGEHEAFIHLLKSASGNIKDKIDKLFEHSVQEKERLALAELIYYPEKQLKKKDKEAEDYEDWFRVTVYQLIEVVKCISEKYTRTHVRKKAPQEFAYIIDELLHVKYENKTLYYSTIIKSLLETGVGDEFIIGLCRMIRSTAIDVLHIIGDIFDRGARADLILDELMLYHDVDIEWGNHDIDWMGAACGNRVCMANVLVSSIKYNSFDFLEDGYGINLRPLAIFANEVYKDDKCKIFAPKRFDENKYDPVDAKLAAKMHKAMVVILFKLEGQLYKKHKEYQLLDRVMLEKINYEKGTITIDGRTYELKDKNFPTIDPKNPLQLTKKEEELMEMFAFSFRHSEKLQKHIRFLYSKGSIYKCYNNNLLYHGCIPFTKDGEFDEIELDGKKYKGKAYLDKINQIVKEALFSSNHPKKENHARDFMWYLWCGPKSPLFGKDRITHFEQYFVDDAQVKIEKRNPYYELIEDPKICDKIIQEFGLQVEHAHIVNGHVPVKIGENPIKAGGKLFIIDGGISKAYRSTTGIGGYTLIYSSNYLGLVEHQPYNGISEFSSPKVTTVEQMTTRLLIGDTDKGQDIQTEIKLLNKLIEEYRSGAMRENSNHLWS